LQNQKHHNKKPVQNRDNICSSKNITTEQKVQSTEIFAEAETPQQKNSGRAAKYL
jgi:hypothetical protein